jgi:hypothetical protein
MLPIIARGSTRCRWRDRVERCCHGLCTNDVAFLDLLRRYHRALGRIDASTG